MLVWVCAVNSYNVSDCTSYIYELWKLCPEGQITLLLLA